MGAFYEGLHRHGGVEGESRVIGNGHARAWRETVGNTVRLCAGRLPYKMVCHRCSGGENLCYRGVGYW